MSELSSLPSDIASYLTPDEKVLKVVKDVKWGSKSQIFGLEYGAESKGEIYITNRRVIFKKGGGFLEGKQIVEASYRHVSSIEFVKESRWGYITAGICVIVFAIFLWWFLSWLSSLIELELGLLGLLPLIIGLLGLVLFFITPPNRFRIHVVGRAPLEIEGDVEDAIKIIREFKEKVEVGP